MLPALPDRLHHGRPQRHHSHHRAHKKVFRRHKPDQPEGDDHAVDRRHQAVDQQQRPLALHLQRGLGVPRAKAVAVQQVGAVLGGTLPHVGHLQQVTGNEITVIAHQRVAVDQHGGHTGNQHHVKGHGRDQPRLGQQPHIQRDGAQHQLGHDAGSRHQRPRPFGREAVRRGGVDIRHRREDHEHQPDLTHIAAKGLDGQAVRPFMHRFDQRVGTPQQGHVAGGQHPVRQILGQRRPVLPGQGCGRQHHHQPQQQHRPGHDAVRQAGVALKPGIRVKQRDFDVERVQPALFDALLGLFLVALKHLAGVGRDLALQQVIGVQAGHQLQQIGL